MKVYLGLLLFALGCGSSYKDNRSKYPEESSNNSWTQGRVVIQNYCVPCHQNAAFVKDRAGWLNSGAPTRAANGTMPPPSALQPTPEERQKLIDISN